MLGCAVERPSSSRGQDRKGSEAGAVRAGRRFLLRKTLVALVSDMLHGVITMWGA